MVGLVEEYFSNISATSNPFGFNDILSGILPMVIEDMNTSLNQIYIANEVVKAFHQMAPLIAPSLDGMPRIFYKSFCHIVGGDVTTAVLNTSFILESIDTTFISLIPKIQNPKKVSDFRLISLCNVFYKLIAKVLVNCLKLVLPYVVADS